MGRPGLAGSARRRLLVGLPAAAILVLALLGVNAVSSLATEPTIEAGGTSLATYAWSPSTAEVDGGGSVAFKNPTATPHGLVWESGPEAPSCTGTSSVGQGSWSGSCTFAQGGTYRFYCPVHPAQMRGTVTVNGPAAPLVNTGAASGVGEAEATLNGTVNPSGQETTFRFDYGPTASYGEKTAETSAGEGTSTVSKAAMVSGLSAATTYHFRIVAKNATGTTFGADRTFSTAGPPSATTATVSTLGEAEATLTGSVTPHGIGTTYFFNYGTTAAYGQETPERSAGAGTAAVAVSAPVGGLSPQTTYHFQLVAKNASGTAAGNDGTFRTAAAPLFKSPPILAPLPAVPVPPLGAISPPDTKITLKPRAKTKDGSPTLKFKATVANATFRCSIDGKPFKACRSPYTTPLLKPGRHTIRIAAVAGGSSDPTPARCSFVVLAAKR